MTAYSKLRNQLIADVFTFERSTFSDDRGKFERIYCKDSLEKLGIVEPLTQINHSYTKNKGTIRGMHFQLPPATETKVITCLSGEIYDVAVDLRHNSPTFLQHKVVQLSAEMKETLVIPKGFAHGFQTLTEKVELLYFHTKNYNPRLESGISPNDKKLDIRWPLKISAVSERDLSFGKLNDDYQGINI